MERAEAEAIYEQGREVVLRVLVELSAQNERLVGQVEQLTARGARQEERIAQLERQAKRSSCNSLSAAEPGPTARAAAARHGPVGPQGRWSARHEGKGRPLLGAWAVDEVVEHWPVDCGCGHVFVEADRVAVGEPARRQVEELRVIA